MFLFPSFYTETSLSGILVRIYDPHLFLKKKMSSQDLTSHKVATIISWILSVYVGVKYFLGSNPYQHSETPFSASPVFLTVYWIVLYVSQLAFITQIFLPVADSPNVTTRTQLTKLVGWHFTAFNLGIFLWSILFAKGHNILSEIVLVFNFVNILLLYFSHKTYAVKPLSNWLLIHLPTAAMPLSWLFFAIFYNGVVLFHVKHFVGRVIANVTIWMFLFVPGFFLVAFNDWAVGLSFSALTFSLGVGQLFTKAFALQWIFAFIISGLLFVLSVVAAFTGTFNRVGNLESAPLLEG